MYVWKVAAEVIIAGQYGLAAGDEDGDGGNGDGGGGGGGGGGDGDGGGGGDDDDDPPEYDPEVPTVKV